MPLGADCSAAISAACHPHPLDTDAVSRLVRWDVVGTWTELASPETRGGGSSTTSDILEYAHDGPYSRSSDAGTSRGPEKL
jgi:hypothetical protein